MKWPPDQGKPAWGPSGRRCAIQRVGVHTVTVVMEHSGHVTTVGREEFTQHWTQDAPEMKPIQEQVWRDDGLNVVDDNEETVAEVHGPDAKGKALAIAALPDMARLCLMVLSHAGPLPMDIDLAARAALKKAGVL